MTAQRVIRKLVDLLDVNSTGLADGDVPTWDSGTSKFTMDAPAAGSSILLPMTFTETASGLTYTASVVLPANTRVLDVLMETTAAWTAATADLDVGDSDAVDALVGAVDVSEQINFPFGSAAFEKGGTDWGNGLEGNDGPLSAGGPGKLYPTGDIITAVVTATVPGGPTGVSRVTLIAQTEATAVAATVAP